MNKEIRLTKGELLRLVWTRPVSALAEEFGLSPNGLAKICDRLDIQRPPKGYWKKTPVGDPGSLPVIVENPDDVIEIGGQQSAARRPRSRLSSEERQAQLIEAAREIACDEGLHQVSLRRVARKIGISEAQAHNVYSTREELLVELALHEIEALEVVRLAAIERGGSRLAKVVNSTLTYLKEVSRRGPILHHIMANSVVRRRVSQRRRAVRRESARRHVDAMLRDKSVSVEEANAQLAVLTAMVSRSAHLVSEERISLDQAERLLVSIVIASATEAPD
ncbi:MAG: TetR/AcrR family transcriptional regulator [Hyphomonas sp.]